MAADSGYYSFSASQSVHADDSSETSERSRSSELQESVDALRAVVGSGRAQILTARCNETITSISANLPTTFTPGKTKSFNRIHRFGKHNVSSRARSYSKITTCQRDDGVARIDKRTEPMPRPSNQIGLDDDTDDLSIATLMTSLCPERAVAKHFTVMINMMRHMNHALFDSESGREDQQHVMEEVKAMSREIIYFFDGVQKSFQDQVDKIEDTKDFLPLLGDNVEQHHLEAAIKIWAEKICENIQKPRRSEERLLEAFANLYDTHVYHPFSQIRRKDTKHTIRELLVYLDSVYNAIEGAIELNRQIVVKMDGLRQSVQRAYDDFCRLPVAWFEIGGLGRAMANVERRMSECRILGNPGTPIMSTEQITNMATSAKGKESKARERA